MSASTDVLDFIRANATGSEFYSSLLRQFNAKGALSDRQIDCVVRAIAQRDAPKVTAEADLSAIHAMFDTARSNGLKRLAYRADGVKITPAAATGRNPGALYVTALSDDSYLGKVVGTTFHASREAPATVAAALATISANPLEAARMWGLKTGECSCCGRELTDPISIAKGIGPICEEKWFGA